MSIYLSSIISRKINIPMHQVGGDMDALLLQGLTKFEGQCIKEGYLKRNSIKILHYSSGIIKGDTVEFEIAFECLLSNPVVGQQINCKVVSVTKAGLKCKLNEDESPFVVFIVRDHHYLNAEFSSIKEGDLVNAKILGQRFEIYDPVISVVATLE